MTIATCVTCLQVLANGRCTNRLCRALKRINAKMMAMTSVRSFNHRTAQRRKPERIARHRRSSFGSRDHAKYPRAVTHTQTCQVDWSQLEQRHA